MKVRHLLELIQDAKYLTDFFEGVESPEQMVSALERLKKREAPEEFLACVQSLKISCDQILEDTLEMSGFEPDEMDEKEEGEFDLEGLGLGLGEDSPAENQNPDNAPVGEVKKTE